MFSKKKNSKTTNYGTNTNDNTRNLEDSSSEEIISLSDHTSYWYAGPRKTTFDIGMSCIFRGTNLIFIIDFEV